MHRQEVIDTLRDHLEELRSMGVTELSLFGSTARDEAGSSSDIDLLVQFDPEMHVGLFGFLRVEQRLNEILGVTNLDLVAKGGLHEELRDNILREAIRVA